MLKRWEVRKDSNGDFENAEIVSHKMFQMAKSERQIGSIVGALFL